MLFIRKILKCAVELLLTGHKRPSKGFCLRIGEREITEHTVACVRMIVNFHGLMYDEKAGCLNFIKGGDMRMKPGSFPGISRTTMLLGEEALTHIQLSHVMIFGLGGVGSYAAEALGRMGVGRLSLVDGDSFEESNLNRQLCALTSTLGKAKVEVTRQRLLDINPAAEITAIQAFYLPDSPVPITHDVDMVVDAIDTIAAKIHIAQTCSAMGIPVISCMGMGNRLDPSQIRIGDLFQTHGCALCRVMRKELRKRGIQKLRCVYSLEEACECQIEHPEKKGRRSVPGSVSYVPSVAGLFMAADVIASLCKQTNSRENI
jgi:tRNA A37 threonylcarbamoyladenosine dehydratase